jgi:cell division protein FtsW (lipid II flippase)
MIIKAIIKVLIRIQRGVIMGRGGEDAQKRNIVVAQDAVLVLVQVPAEW